ncbi:4-aminobutyrate--2-oxoglutarate transaminase [Glaciimonas sp. PCH181]|uniref:4-aminobutyrate--2-oxoglutarate transaminase n=1 Tax=Glaciimonas sp. PCH181 TaxID=2133943 RepID=UPI000D34F836|nr:4-aminobutyrate--2-oxoglutarate transaminase [Glaciimonas sp. PCH181]PUA17701.1 4-aminobutyrate--2-oxoglutarate transaminase [Glaciimonas sp. PCH181]
MNADPITSNDLLTRRTQNVPRGLLTAHPIVISRGEGAHVWTTDGRKYIDLVAGIGVLNVGHNHPRVVAAVKRQLDLLSHTCFQVGAYEPYIELASRLNTLVGGSVPHKTVFLTTGAEATENAIKIARGYTNRPGVIAFRGGFHGRTLMGMSLTGMSEPYKQNFGPFAPDIYHVPFPDAYRGVTSEIALAALKEVFATNIAANRVAAIIIEPVQGDGGFLPAPDDFMQALRKITEEHGILLIADEIQTGFGRTGKMFGFQHSGITPDLVTLAKSLAGGLPLSAVTGKADIMDGPTPGGLGGTYGGNPLSCAAGLAVLDIFEEENLLERGLQLGQRMLNGFNKLQEKYPQIGEVRGLGAMLAIEFVKDATSKEPDPAMAQRVMERARENRVLVIKCGVHRNVVRSLIPLVADDATVDEAIHALDKAIGEAIGTAN